MKIIETQKKKHFFFEKKIFHKSNKAFFYKKNEETYGCYFALTPLYSFQLISVKRLNRLPSRSMISKNMCSGRTQYWRSP